MVPRSRFRHSSLTLEACRLLTAVIVWLVIAGIAAAMAIVALVVAVGMAVARALRPRPVAVTVRPAPPAPPAAVASVCGWCRSPSRGGTCRNCGAPSAWAARAIL